MNKTILLLVVLLVVPMVFAEPVCCEKANSGATCQYIEQSECAAGSKSAPTNCYFTSFCKLGTCFDLNDGRCYANMPLATCAARGDTATFSDLSVENTPQCSVGCCIIGDQASLITQTRCKKETSKYPDLQMVFKEDIKEEVACVQLARNSDKGCCVENSDNCKYTTRANCALPTGTDLAGNGFFDGKFCSDQKLNCDCTPHAKKGCLGSSDDVYWFDSCGNPEEVAQDCDYVDKQNICGKSRLTEDYTCVDLSCNAENDIFNMDAKQIYSDSEKLKNGESWCEYDVNMNEYNGRKALIGFGRDVPGSRYYRGVCINNKVLVSPCKDFREEWCVSDEAKINNQDYSFAACRLNRWNDCTKQDNKLDCKNTEKRDCYWAAAGDKCVPFVDPGSKFWEEENKDICSQGSQTCEVQIKVPGLTKLLADSGKHDISKNTLGLLIQGFGQLMNMGGTEGLAEAPTCIANCQCLEHEYTITSNNYCRSLGDCGAEFNLLTEKKENILTGFKITHGDDIPDVINYAKGLSSKDPGKITYADLDNWKNQEKIKDGSDDTSGFKIEPFAGPFMTNALLQGVFVMGDSTMTDAVKKQVWAKNTLGPLLKIIDPFTQMIPGLGEFLKENKWWQENVVKAMNINVVSEKAFKEAKAKAAEKITDEIKERIRKEAIEETQQEGTPVMEEEFKKRMDKEAETQAYKDLGIEVDPTTGQPTDAVISKYAGVMKIVSVASYIHMALQLIDMTQQEIVTVDIETTCESWQAPTNSQDCEKCNPDDINSPSWRKNKLCSEYTCKSFGQSCALLNPGTGNDTCASQNPRDVVPPAITMWKDVLGNYKDKVTEVPNKGYTYTAKIPAFTLFPMAIKTNEPAICKASLNNSARFEDITGNFGANIYSYEHFTLNAISNTYELSQNGTLVAAPGQAYILYVKCQDSLGNQNEAPYYVKYSIEQGPDVTPPVIEGANIADGSYFRYGINESDVELYLNEPAECKWSNMDKDYNQMENTMTCATRTNELLLYPCTTKLTPLIDQIVNKFYFRCKDQPGVSANNRNTNEQSFTLTLRGSYPLKLDLIEPSGEITTRNFTLRVETSRGATYDGKAYCYYGNIDDINLMNLFYKTNSSVHEQLLSPSRSSTAYKYYVKCVDYGGNIVSANTTITMSQDVNAPRVAGIYEDTSFTPSHLRLILDEVAECQYNMGKDFTYGDGSAMTNDKFAHDTLFEDGATYYIKCLDASNNLMSYIFHA